MKTEFLNNSLINIVEHPLAKHCVMQLRNQDSSVAKFRHAMSVLTQVLFWQASQKITGRVEEVLTPLGAASGFALNESEVVLIPIMRAGLGMLAAIQALIPDCRVGFVGLARNETTLQAHSYYTKFPEFSSQHHIFVLDPMLATGNSVCRALQEIRESGGQNIHLICALAAPEGITHVQEAFPKIPITVAAVDEKLTDEGFIFPGLGDAGDRLMGT